MTFFVLFALTFVFYSIVFSNLYHIRNFLSRYQAFRRRVKMSMNMYVYVMHDRPKNLFIHIVRSLALSWVHSVSLARRSREEVNENSGLKMNVIKISLLIMSCVVNYQLYNSFFMVCVEFEPFYNSSSTWSTYDDD